MWALLKVTLSSYYPMIIAPPLDPMCEAPEAIQVEAGGLIEEVLDVGHKAQWTGLLKLQGFLLMLDEVVKEPLLGPGPFRLCKVVNTVLIIDLEDMLQVLPPSTAMKVCCQLGGIMEGRPCLTSPLGLGSFRCWWWWWGTTHGPGGQVTLLTWQLHTHCPWHTPWVTDGSAAVSPPSCCRPSVVLHCTTHGGGFICGGVSNDSPPHRPLWWLHRLLVGHSRLLWAWPSDRRHHLGRARHQRGWRWHLLGQSAWVGCPCDPLCCALQSGTPPSPREVWWGCDSSRCRGLRRQQPPFGEVYGREAWWGQ